MAEIISIEAYLPHRVSEVVLPYLLETLDRGSARNDLAETATMSRV